MVKFQVLTKLCKICANGFFFFFFLFFSKEQILLGYTLWTSLVRHSWIHICTMVNLLDHHIYYKVRVLKAQNCVYFLKKYLYIVFYSLFSKHYKIFNSYVFQALAETCFKAITTSSLIRVGGGLIWGGWDTTQFDQFAWSSFDFAAPCISVQCNHSAFWVLEEKIHVAPLLQKTTYTSLACDDNKMTCFLTKFSILHTGSAIKPGSKIKPHQIWLISIYRCPCLGMLTCHCSACAKLKVVEVTPTSPTKTSANCNYLSAQNFTTIPHPLICLILVFDTARC